MEVPVEPGVRDTGATGSQERPVEGLALKMAVPLNPLIEVAVMLAEPEFAARMLDGEKGPRETLISGAEADPYTPLASMTPVMLKPFGSKRESRPLFVVTGSGKATDVPLPATATYVIVKRVPLPERTS